MQQLLQLFGEGRVFAGQDAAGSIPLLTGKRGGESGEQIAPLAFLRRFHE
jgi:hypothetical protein